jgi:hypothetical protein
MTRPLPSLYNNGALDPNQWKPSYDNIQNGRLPAEGDHIAWRYAAWAVVESRPIPDADLPDGQLQELHRHIDAHLPAYRDRVRERAWPRRLVLRHHSGPLLLSPDEPVQRLHDGTVTVHSRTKPYGNDKLPVLTNPYRTCSCHGHIWPCQDVDRDTLARHQTQRMDTLMAGAQPGVCQACRQPITARQKTVTYPGEHLDLPGGPPPTFHTRDRCRGAAVDYEVRWIAADLRRERILSYPKCPGLLLVHADGASECVPTTGWDGRPALPQPDCMGHATHDHDLLASCYVHGCTRGCVPERHPGTGGVGRRPERRPQSTTLI